ncbi:MAG: phosphatidylinositol-specific phospholipase C1-like protein [bacterium]|nr:phosphatidylinositol-specific phospholipase C1-like protein [bacterium]
MRTRLLAPVLAVAVLAAAPCADLLVPEPADAAPVKTARCRRAASKLEALERRIERARRARPARARRLARLGRSIADRCVALNQVQVLGTHNSYHIQPGPQLFPILVAFSPLFLDVEYTHVPLEEQLETQGIRQIELDVFADPHGGLYARRGALTVIGRDPDTNIPELLAPGFKVLHTQDVDFETTCLTFVDCLRTVKAWSDANRGHLPIMIMVELKDDPIPDPGLDFAIPIPILGPELDALDAEIRSVFPPERLITPDDVRGKAATLDEAVRTRGWPSLRESRGRVLFALDNGGAKSALYREGRPSLEGRVLFTNADPGAPDAAFVKRNDPIGDTDIPDLVATGYIVRTRADGDTREARSGDTAPREAALASGAQYVSTDYPVPNPDFGTGYQVAIPDGAPGRCNPVNAPRGCRSWALETPTD